MKQFVEVYGPCGKEKIRIVLECFIDYDKATDMYRVQIPEQRYAITEEMAILGAPKIRDCNGQ